MLERYFKLAAHGTNVRTEVMAGITTFLTMAYIIFVNPDILSAAGMPKESVFVATCLAAAIGSAIMGFYANYPIALAPGMGLNAYFAYAVVKGMGYTWQVALGAVFISGCLFVAVGVFAAPPSIDPTLFKLDIMGALSVGILNVVLVFFLVELFDATGTLLGVAKRAGLLVPGRMERLNRALFADSIAIFAGSLLGTSSTTAYAESAAGVQAGGRTGLTALTVAILFLACLVIAPLAGVVPAYA